MSEHKNVREIKDAEFQTDVIDAKLPVLIDFWAPWCGPCLMVAPTLAKVADHLKGKVLFMKMNVDENPMTPSRYGVRSIPTLILFKDQKNISSKVGVQSEQGLIQWIESLI